MQGRCSRPAHTSSCRRRSHCRGQIDSTVRITLFRRHPRVTTVPQISSSVTGPARPPASPPNGDGGDDISGCSFQRFTPGHHHGGQWHQHLLRRGGRVTDIGGGTPSALGRRLVEYRLLSLRSPSHESLGPVVIIITTAGAADVPTPPGRPTHARHAVSPVSARAARGGTDLRHWRSRTAGHGRHGASRGAPPPISADITRPFLPGRHRHSRRILGEGDGGDEQSTGLPKTEARRYL